MTGRVDRAGVLLVLLSSATFGANAIFAKLAYRAGVSIAGFLSLRFLMAAVLFWALLRPRPTRSELRGGLLLGLAYCGQAGFFFTAVSLQDASVTSVLSSITPAVVAGLAVLLGREPARPLLFVGIAAAGLGVVLVGLGGGHGGGRVSGPGTACAVAAGIWYAGYLMAGDRVVSRVDPRLLGCLVATGGAIGFAVGAAALGRWRLDLPPLAWLWIASSAVVSTVVAVTSVLAGMRRVGPSLTGLLTSTETVATIGYAFVVFGERLTAVQLAGAALVVAAVVGVQLVERRPGPVQVS